MTGIGISKKDINRIFNPFERAISPELEGNVVGTGLGLSITKLLIERMNGKISLKSKVGVGSRFNVKIPVKSAKSNAINDIESFDQKIIGYKGPKIKIIVTDDDPAHCKLIMDILFTHGILILLQFYAFNSEVITPHKYNNKVNIAYSKMDSLCCKFFSSIPKKLISCITT